MHKNVLRVAVSALVLLQASPLFALDLSGGLLTAVPVKNGQAPVIDGALGDWDLSGVEPVWATNQTAEHMHGNIALEYDSEALYYAADITLPNRHLLNSNGPADPYWAGDMIELRVSSDPAMPFPLVITPKLAESDRVVHLAFWKNTEDGKNYLGVQYGAKFDKGKAINPAGSQVVLKERPGGYYMEARIPWTAMNVPGGHMPFGPGQKMTATASVHWGFEYQIPMVFIQNPGSFAFHHPETWGQVEFSPTGNVKPRHGTMEAALEAARPKSIGVPITVNVPATGKISVNILGNDGSVLREVCGGVPVQQGKFTVKWDGRDQWGNALAAGSYHWGAYFSGGLKPQFMGQVGTSNNPAHHTVQGLDGWGGDHGFPVTVSSDSSGRYFGWSFAEAQPYTVKTDPAGKMLWRKSPFVQGGFSQLVAVASNGTYLFSIWNGPHPLLSRQSAASGALLPFGDIPGAGSTVPITAAEPVAAAGAEFPYLNPAGTAPDCLGLAASEKEVFASVYSQNIIQVMDGESARPLRTLTCKRPRGLALSKTGDLYAVSYGADQTPQVVRFAGCAGEALPVITSGLVAPVGVAVDEAGTVFVTDIGTSQQVKIFDATGKQKAVVGKLGGRQWAGTYDSLSLLNPTGICAESAGVALVAETSIPKVFDRITDRGTITGQWFGWPAYGVSNIPDSEDPWTSYYPFEPGGFGRARVPHAGGVGIPTAYWDLPRAGIEGVGDLFAANNVPEVKKLANGRKYFVSDANPHGIALVQGDTIRPVARLESFPAYLRSNTRKQNYLEIWTDNNGDGKPSPDEVETVLHWKDGPLPVIGSSVGSMWLDGAGNAYFVAPNNVIKLPVKNIDLHGVPHWDSAKMSYVVPVVLPSMLQGFGSGYRQGMGGIRLDSKGNVYTCLSVTIPGLTDDLAKRIAALYPHVPRSQWSVYATPELAKSMHEGLGHTAESTAVKFAKFGPDGKMLWIAGRKATAAPQPGEMYHFWCLAGLIGDGYVAGASEWGQIYVYTSDGFFVDALMNDPNQLNEAGPYTFGSETFSGRVQSFPALGEAWAYTQGGLYKIEGLDKNLKVAGEKRLKGTVQLDKVYGDAPGQVKLEPLTFYPVADGAANSAEWLKLPAASLVRGGNNLAEVKLGYDSRNIYARFHVQDATPLQNASEDVRVAFKGGDSVALDLGKAGDRSNPQAGDVRILAAMVAGKPRLIGMKPLSTGAPMPNEYFTPAGGTRRFAYVGEIPGGQVELTTDLDGAGYSAYIAVPRTFLESEFGAGTKLKGDVEVLLSGQGSRGAQTLSRNPYYSGGHEKTTMVDDTPTEAWLYPEYWGDVLVK